MRKTPVVLGTLSIIFGSLTGAWSLFTPMVGPLMQKMFAFTRNLPGHDARFDASHEASLAVLGAQQGYMLTSAVIYVLMSAALVVIGVGLHRRRAWARRAGVGWGLLALAILVGFGIYSFGWMQPHSAELQHAAYAARGLPDPPRVAGAQGTAFVLSEMLYAVYPIVLLALLGRRSAARDFVSPTPAS